MAFILTIAQGRGRGRRFQFDAPPVSIGRGGDNDVVLSDAGVSRTHARIEKEGAGWLLFDEGSANGTELNGAAIALPARLRQGDRIGVGAVTLEFSGGDTPGETRVCAPAAGPGRPVEPRAGGRRRHGGIAQLPLRARLAAVVVLALLLALAARIASRERNPQRGPACPETVAVDDDTAQHSFGHGEVDVDCGERVVFGFRAPPQTRALFHYTPLRVGAPAEVELRVNGRHLAWAKAAAGRGEPQVLEVPEESQGPDGRNFIALSQTQPGKEWSVGKVRVELLAVTAGDLAAAQQAYDRGRRKLKERHVAPRNLYDAWSAFTEARRQLQGLARRPALHGELAQLIEDAERDLDKECKRLLFTAARLDRYGQADKAQRTYRDVLLHFPGEEPAGCRRKAQENIVSAQSAEAAEQ